MNTDAAPRGAERRGQLQLVGSRPPLAPGPGAAAAAPDPVTPHERAVMSALAEHLRRCARELPVQSHLRAELLETAEYYALGAEADAGRTGSSPPVRASRP